MKFKMPETLEGLSVEEIDALYKKAWEEHAAIAVKDDAEISDADLADLDALGQALDALGQAKGEIEAADQARADRLAAARARTAPEADAEGDDDAETEDDDAEGGDDAPEGDADTEDEGADAEAEQEKELVTASATRRKVVRTGASKAPKPQEVIDAPSGTVLRAAANLPTKTSNEEFASYSEAAQIWEQKISKSPAGSSFRSDINDLRPATLSGNQVRQGFMKIHKPESEFATGMDVSVEEQLRVIDAAANERARFGAGGLAKRPITAAGGWCAPSETMYDFCSYETVSGILDIPTVTIRRGGINFTKGPDYATLAATWGFLQTEAQAEAGTEKVCYPVECPPFAETRMDAIGFCITAGVLTASPGGYPELIRRVLEIGTVAHAHKVNAEVINRISTIIGTAVNWGEIGSTVSDILDSVELQAIRMRYQLAMDPNATLEAVFPLWALGLVRADVGRRLNIDNPLNVTDDAIRAWFSVRQVRPQFVYDYQPPVTGAVGTGAGTAGWTTFPTNLEYMLYPAGAFIKGTSAVIDLDTIYDSVGLSTNTYTAAFFEEGLLVANRCGFGIKVALTGLNRLGASGFPSVGAGAGVTFATV